MDLCPRQSIVVVTEHHMVEITVVLATRNYRRYKKEDDTRGPRRSQMLSCSGSEGKKRGSRSLAPLHACGRRPCGMRRVLCSCDFVNCDTALTADQPASH